MLIVLPSRVAQASCTTPSGRATPPPPAGEIQRRGDRAEWVCQIGGPLRLGLEGVLALLEHLPRLGQLGLSAVGALADGDLLLQLGDGVGDAAAQGAEDVPGLLCGLFLWMGTR